MPTRRRKAIPPTIVALVRHGTTPTTGKVLPGRAPGLRLAPEGRSQAREVAEQMATVPRVDAVYTSPILRARETATAIGHRLGIAVKVDRGLQECDFGEWTGEELSSLRKLPEWRRVQRWPSGFRFPGGESFAEMAARIAGTIGRLVTLHPGGTVVAVSHADPIKAAVASALGTHLDLFQRILISPCSVTTIAYGNEGPTVLGVNTPPRAPGTTPPDGAVRR